MKHIRDAIIGLAVAIVTLMLVGTPVHAQNPSCGKPHFASGHHSLMYIGDHFGPYNRGEGISNILRNTFICNGGKNFPYFMQFYLGVGDMTAPLEKGTRFWTYAP